MAHKLVVISYDALQSDDLPELEKMPFFSKILPQSAVVKAVRPIYPTLTYPIHTTLITGVRPDRHGIIHNQIPGLVRENPDWSIHGSDWYWYKKDVKAKTLMDAVWEQGRKVSNVLWPVTAGEKRFLSVPPIWPDKKQDPEKLMREAMSDAAYLRFYPRFQGMYDWKNTDDMRIYGVEIALEVLEDDRPDLLMHHVVHLDHARHQLGDHGTGVHDCLRELDIIGGRFVRAAKQAGILENTNFVFLGDHGQIDVENVFRLNRLFAEEGLIRLDAVGQPEDYDAYSFSSGFSSQIYLKNPGDTKLRERVHEFLLNMQKRYPQYLERVYTAEELKKEGMAGEGLCFMVEGTRGTIFDKKMQGPLIVSAASPGYSWYKASHGHHPDKKPQPPLLAFGPDIRPGVRLEKADILDICPTLAALAQVKLDGLSGKILPILKESGGNR